MNRKQRMQYVVNQWGDKNELSIALGVTVRALNQWLTGYREPPEPTVRLAELLYENKTDGHY